MCCKKRFVDGGRVANCDECRPLEQWALDQRRLSQHQRERATPCYISAVDFRNPAPGDTARIQERLPVERNRPSVQHLQVEPVRPQIVKLVLLVIVCQPFASLAAGIAARYSVNRQNGQ